MKSTLSILSTLKQSLDHGMAQDTINGKVYLNELPGALQNENIVVNCLVNPGTYVQQAIVNLNIYVNGIHEKQANLAKMHSIVEAIIPLVHNTTHYIGGVTLHTDIVDDKGVFPDIDYEGLYFYNLRLNCITL